MNRFPHIPQQVKVQLWCPSTLHFGGDSAELGYEILPRVYRVDKDRAFLQCPPCFPLSVAAALMHAEPTRNPTYTTQYS